MTQQNATLDPNVPTLAPLIDPYRMRIEEALKKTLHEAGDLPMYGMLRYFLGHEDEHFQPQEISAGKRIRPALFMYVNEAFGGSQHAIDLAVAIELFHNFTLIHDDIEDHDELRRGRKTVWKVWGINHAINAGDAQSLIASTLLTKAVIANPAQSGSAAMMLHQKFLEVAEGQYLDFELSTQPLSSEAVTKEAYLEMIRKKTSVLVGGSVAAGGMAAGCSDAVAKDLYEFGESLGLAYQIADDIASVWSDSGFTGKEAYGDIYERKKTLPLLIAYSGSSHAPRLAELYSKAESLTEFDVQEIIALLNDSDAFAFSKNEALFYMNKAKEAAARLPIAKEYVEALIGIVNAFVQFPRPHA